MHESVKSFDLSIDKNNKSFMDKDMIFDDKKSANSFEINTQNGEIFARDNEKINTQNKIDAKSLSNAFLKAKSAKEFEDLAVETKGISWFLSDYNNFQKPKLATDYNENHDAQKNINIKSSDEKISDYSSFDFVGNEYKNNESIDFYGVGYKSFISRDFSDTKFKNNKNLDFSYENYKNTQDFTNEYKNYYNNSKILQNDGSFYKKSAFSQENTTYNTAKQIDYANNTYGKSGFTQESGFKDTRNTNFDELYSFIENKLRQEMRD